MGITTISFKSAGKTIKQRQDEKLQQTITPIGIRTPLRPASNNEGIWSMTTTVADEVHDNLRNLILTNWGERLGLYNFGANLRELTTNFNNQDNFDAEAVLRIKNAVSRWMPFIELELFSSEVDYNQNEHIGKVRLVISYNVPALNVKDKTLEVTLYVI